MFGRNWKKAEGTVVERQAEGRGTGRGLEGSTFVFVVDVDPANEPAFRSRVDTPHLATDFAPPRAGMTVGVEFDPKSRKVRFDKSDPRLSSKAIDEAFSQQQKDRVDAALEHPPGSKRP